MVLEYGKIETSLGLKQTKSKTRGLCDLESKKRGSYSRLLRDAAGKVLKSTRECAKNAEKHNWEKFSQKRKIKQTGTKGRFKR